ncbi:MAG: hypothetical protein AAF197_09215 [Pseudomonadota bacterium]
MNDEAKKHLTGTKTKFNDLWYRNYMVWLVILLPTSVVCASLFTIYLAISHAPEIVTKPEPRIESTLVETLTETSNTHE